MQSCGGIVLCGGRSSRMGVSKAMLPFGPERMLQRVVRLLGEAVSPIVVVAAHDQPLPDLPAATIVVRDEREAYGPLEGLRAGMATLAGFADRAYATSCDVPLLKPAFVRALVELASQSNRQIVAPHAEGYRHPLAAVYSISLLPVIEQLIARDRTRLMDLLDVADTMLIDERQLRRFDSGLDSLRNLNRPEEYLAALTGAGLAIEPEIAARLKLAAD